jgi:hypothetical protein
LILLCVVILPLDLGAVGHVIHGAELCFREFVQIRTVSHPEAAALPAGLGIIDSAIQAARVERPRVRHAEHRERFLLVDPSTIRPYYEIPVLVPQMIALYTDGGWE